MAIQHEVTRDLLIEYMHSHKISDVEELTELYKKIYNTVQASTESQKALFGFKKSKKD